MAEAVLALTAKLALTILAVLVLAEVSRRAGPHLAGIISGLPLGAGITMYFVAREQGTAFALAAVPWGILGLSSSIVFSLAYLLAGRAPLPRGRIARVCASTAAALLAYGASAFALRGFQATLPLSLTITLAVAAANLAALERLAVAEPSGLGRAAGLGPVLVRAAVAGAIVSAVTGAAQAVGSAWTGLFSGFPMMLMPLYVLLHYEEGDRLYPGVIRGFAWSVVNLVIFYLLILALLPRLGLNASFLVIYAASALVLWGLNAAKRRFARRGRGPPPK